MSENNKNLVVSGRQITLPSFGGVMSEKGSLLGVRRFVAAKAGLSDTDIAGKTYPEVKILAEAAGATKDQLKAWGKIYDEGRASFYAESSKLTGMLAADPSWRKSVRVQHNKAGDLLGVQTTFRRERSPQGLVAQLALARAEIATLRAALPA